MKAIENEQNIEVLRGLLIYAINSGNEYRRKYETILNEQESTKQTSFEVELMDQLHRLKVKFFGFGRETNPEAPARPTGHKGDKLGTHSSYVHDQKVLNLKSENEALKPDLPKTTLYEMTSPELTEESSLREIPVGADAWKKMEGLYQESHEVTVTERVYERVVHRQQKYKLKDEYNTTGKEVIIAAKGPVKVKPGMEYSVDFALSVVSDKYEYHLPLERQHRKMEEAGFNVDTKTLYNMCAAVSEHADRVIPRILKGMMSDYCALHVDESPWQILGHQNREQSYGYMWVMSNRVGAVYRFEPTRSGKVPVELLKNYDGAIVCDAYGGYNKVKKETSVRAIQNCWAHARREFFERYDDYPKETVKMIALIDELFDIEAKATSIEHMKELRKTESKLIVERLKQNFFEILPGFLPESGIVKAIQYCLNHWEGLTLFLKDASAPLSNNDAERALRHVVMGRKNFLGSKTVDGADVAASLYTIIESSKRVGLHPTEYFKYLITEHWHKREAMTPAEYSVKKFGANKRFIYPARGLWRIEV